MKQIIFIILFILILFYLSVDKKFNLFIEKKSFKIFIFISIIIILYNKFDYLILLLIFYLLLNSNLKDYINYNFEYKLLLENTYFIKIKNLFNELLFNIKYENYNSEKYKNLKNKNKIILFFRIISEFPLAFIKYYIIRRHFTGAITGLLTALILAYFRWKRVIFLFKN